ncbi:MAG: hypothetical protein C5B50_09720 [Verrucomicrobia bacterium]|nr:MAG: hypothetical protein C5B50_09720 [Verrucomicrobiota bacterium]
MNSHRTSRREFLARASIAGTGLFVGSALDLEKARAVDQPALDSSLAYKYRIAFGAWINDMRCEALPLENWPAPQLDDECVRSLVRIMDLQSRAGYNLFDVWGLFATYGWPVDITSAVDGDRRKRIKTLFKAAKHRGLKLSLGLGTYSWGYDKIIEADPSVRGKNQDGSAHPHAMCDANPKSWGYVRRIIDFVLSEWDFGGVHLESCDLGCCFCPNCAGKDGVVAYNARINRKTADYIRQKWPEKIVYVITISWLQGHPHFNEQEKGHLLELSKHVDCIFDQGHTGYQLDPKERREFIQKMSCAYGTSGQLWLYHDTRWDRASYFLPYVRRAVDGIKFQYADGVRGCLYYQGPPNNAGAEVQTFIGGRILSDTTKSAEDVLTEAVRLLYKPKDPRTGQRLVELFFKAEDSYFGNWPRQTESFKKLYGFVPGEFKLWQGLWGTSPGPSSYLKEPMLDATGRKVYKEGLVSILKELPSLEGKCDDGGRLENIKRSVGITLNTLNTIQSCLGEG